MLAHEGVDLQALIVGHQHFLARVVERENALVGSSSSHQRYQRIAPAIRADVIHDLDWQAN